MTMKGLEMTMSTDNLEDALERCFIADMDNGAEPENVAGAMLRAAISLRAISNAITPGGTIPMPTPGGGQVGSLTEAVIYAAQSLRGIADAIGDLASAVRERE